MNIKRILFSIGIGLFTAILPLQSQITIGSSHKPNIGTLLDLKQESDGSSKKGLMLPRVDITEKDKLHPMLPLGYNATEDAKHTGLWVYNTNFVDDICPGPYAWSGTEWNKLLGEPCFYLKLDPLVLNFRKTPTSAMSVLTKSYPQGLPATVAVTAGNIGNWTSVFPNNGNPLLASYDFRPGVNDSGGNRSATVTFTITKDGIAQSQDLIINQTLDDVFFDYTPKTTFPAVAGARALSVTSEADWKSASNSNAGMFTTCPTTFPTQSKGTSKLFNFDLRDNPTWANRIATLKITSPNDTDFAPQNMTVTQGFKALHLTRVSHGGNPSNINLGALATPANVNYLFDVNAGWVVKTTTGIGTALASTNPALSVVQAGSTSALVDHRGSLTIVPKAYTAVGSPAAGTIYPGSIVLETRNHTGATAKTQTINVTRTVPVLFTSPTITVTTIPRTGGASGVVPVSATTNAAWSARWYRTTVGAITAGAVINMAANTYASRSIMVNTLPENKTWGNYTYKMQVSTNSWVNSQDVIGNITQAGYTFLRTGITTGNIVRAAATRRVSANTDGAWSVYYNLSGNANTVETGIVSKPALATLPVSQYLDISIPAYNVWGSRTLNVYTKHNNIRTLANTFTQTGYWLNLSSHNFTGTIPANGQTYSATFAGDVPSNFDLITTYGDGSPRTTASGGVGPRNISIPPNPTTTARAVNLFYSRNGISIGIATLTQEGQTWIDAGSWWMHDTPVNGGTIISNWNGVSGREACVNAYGAGWDSVWLSSSNSREGGHYLLHYKSPVYDAWSAAGGGAMRLKSPVYLNTISIYNHNNGNFSWGDATRYYPSSHQYNTVRLSDLEYSYHNREITVICARPK